MKKLLIYTCCIFLLIQAATANTYKPISSAGYMVTTIKHIKAPLRFSTYRSYFEYLSIKAFKGVDSANLFYRKEFEKAAETFTDYLPLTGGALTGALAGTSATFSSSMGVGTTSPNKGSGNIALTVNGTSNSTVELATGDALKGYFYHNGSAMVLSNFISGSLQIRTNDVNAIYIDADQKVGIGLSSPTSLFEVRKDQSAMTQIILNNANTTSASTRFSMYRGVTEMANINFAGTGDDLVIANRTENTDANIHFALSDGIYGVTFRGNGNVGIGITTPSEKLSVNGNISANGNITTKKLTVTQTPWSDYVFNKDYKLGSLQSLESFINQYKHLPEVPTTKEVESKGISVGDNQALLLKKIEELTLYIIEMNKRISIQDENIGRLQKLAVIRKKNNQSFF